MRLRAQGIIAAELLASLMLIVGVALNVGGGGAGRGQGANRWVFDTASSRRVAEARCAYDLSQGPVRVTAEPWPGALSVSIRAANGALLLGADERSAPQGVDVVLASKGQAAPRGARVVISPSERGVVLDRRPTPTRERFAAADLARRASACGPVGTDFPAVPRR